MSLEKGKLVFQNSLSENPFKPDRVSFLHSQQKGAVWDKNGENDEFAFYPLKIRASLLRPPKRRK